MTNDFVHLHVHSEYSMLDGLGRIKELVKEAKRLGQPALALTDHGVMHGAIEFFRACKDYEVKPIVGIEAYQTVWGRPMGGRDGQLDRENYHLLLMAKNMTGYRNLLKIASHSQLNGYYYKPRVDHDFLAKHAEGIICTTGCLGAEVPQLLMQGKEQEAYNRLGWYVDLFGKENFYIELQEHSIPELIPVNKALVPWAEKFGIGLLATNDVHYVKETDADPHEMLLCVQTGESIKSTKRMRLSDQSYFLKSREQMEATFRPFIDLPASAYDNSLRIAEMVDIDLEDKSYHLPDMEIPAGFTYDTYLRHLTEEGLIRIYGERASNVEIQTRKEFELSVIKKMGFDIYFLIVADLCRFALSRNIWWNVRGSGAGSLVAYCTGITGIDPLKNNLIFERFLNPARVTMPDFDLDFPDDQREEMIRYTIEKYGREKVAQIVTFGRMKARAAIKDVGRAQEIPLNQVNRISQLIPAIPGKPVLIKEVMTEGHEFYNPELVQLYKDEPWVTSLLDYSMQLEGVTRHSGIHAAAVIVADKELVHYAPLMRPSKGSVTETVAQFEFPILESIGLLKVDFLGLSTLSVMREAGRLIKERHGIEYTLYTIPFEGEVTDQAFKLLSSGEVSGVFQVESAGMRRVLTEMKPHLFEHIIATISLYRPGPLEYIPNYIRRLHGDEEIEYKHETLKSILEETYGIVIYQEQIIQILNKLAGYTAGEADLVRRAISKKKASDIEKHKKIFVDGCAKNSIPKEAAEAIYGDIEFFARYGFNKCLPGDVEVLDAATGHLVKVADLYTGAAQLATTLSCDIETLKLQSSAVSAVMDNGVKPVYRITTESGRTIEATANHPFYTFEGWRLLEELTTADLIATPRMIPVEGRTEWPDYQVIALAHLVANGYRHAPHIVCFYAGTAAQQADFIQAVEHFANVICTVKPAARRGRRKAGVSTIVEVNPRDPAYASGLATWAQQMGIGPQSTRNQAFPAAVFGLTNRQIVLLIGRLWDDGGHIMAKSQLNYTTTSEPLTRQLQHLLLRLGVISRLYPVSAPTHRMRVLYYLCVTDQQNVWNFAEKLVDAFIMPEKRALLQERLAEPVNSGAWKDVIPLAIRHLVRTVKAEKAVAWTKLHDEEGIALRTFNPKGKATKIGYQRRTIQRLADYFDSSVLRRYAESDIYWDHIRSIEYVGEKQTYDLEVPGLHNFIANDILVHNSHAADYAAITVQTAYLKAHYPVEYMAALLLIERDKTEKVVNFINECRRMGISVLPPDVNYSGLDFDIQTLPPDLEPARRDPMLAFKFPVLEGSAIRFGMAAVKMVGEGPVNVILEARREGGPFKSLEEFANRIDLRKVGKRPIECLIKVGAFDRFGKRSQLLAVIDQMVANSGSVHDARASGQLSMFDLISGGSAASISTLKLPNIEEVKGREKLTWEKELLGVYAASHPMQSLGIDMSKIVTCYCNELSEEHNGKNVTLAGMITTVRTINTKKGDQMAFVQLEDRQGQCEVVVFPRTYLEVKDKLVPDTLVIMKGKAQTREGQTSLLVDSIQTYVDQAMAGGAEQIQVQRPLLDVAAPTINGLAIQEATPTYDTTMPSFVMSDDDDFGTMHEEDPFRTDPPNWLPTDAPDQEDAPANRTLPAIPPATAVVTAKVDNSKKPILPEPIVAPSVAAKAIADETTKTPIEEPISNGSPITDPPITDSLTTRLSSPKSTVVPPAEANKRISITSSLSGALNQTTNGHSQPLTGTNGSVNGNGANGAHAKVEDEKSKVVPIKPSAAQAMSETADAKTVATPSNTNRTKSAAPSDSNRDANSGHRTGRHPDRPGQHPNERCLHITFRRSGNLDRDKYRLKEIYDHVRDPRGRDRFFIVLESNGQRCELAFPNDPCSINERLMSELTKHFRVDVLVEEGK